MIKKKNGTGWGSGGRSGGGKRKEEVKKWEKEGK